LRTTSACTPGPVTRAFLLRCGHGPNFEIFEFTSPGQRRELPRMSDWGGMHLAFYVDAMDAAIAYLAEHDIEVLGGKRPGLDAESSEGSTFAHFHTPWGMLLELVSFPRGKTYMDGRERVLWQPHHPEL
jgi:catechol 2,3-dioxygenase-like lactoylglutathione lyase family enzyme